jgi:hypothetical protein
VRRLAAGFLWTALAALTLPGCQIACAARDLARAVAEPGPEKPSILLKVTPQVSHAPAEVRIVALVKDPGNVLRCPSFDMEYGDREGSEREQACPPAAEYQDAYALNVPNHKYRAPGVYEVTLRVLVDGKTVLSETVRVLVVGPDDDTSMRTAASR